LHDTREIIQESLANAKVSARSGLERWLRKKLGFGFLKTLQSSNVQILGLLDSFF